MPLSAMPPDPNAGGPSPDLTPRDHFADFVNRNRYVPMWAHPDIARSMVRHFGRTGHVFVHPHPDTGYAAGGVTQTPYVMPPAPALPPQQARPQPRTNITPMARPVAGGAPQGGVPQGGVPQTGVGISPLAGIRQASRSIFTGGDIGSRGPIPRTVNFVQKGGMMDGRGGAGRVPGQEVPTSQKEGHDTVHAMLDPGELVANQKQLRGLQVKPGKAHLLRDDQKRAIKQASRKNASRK